VQAARGRVGAGKIGGRRQAKCGAVTPGEMRGLGRNAEGLAGKKTGGHGGGRPERRALRNSDLLSLFRAVF
jgi:hypothetical protein